MSGITLASVDQCRRLIDSTFQKNPKEFEAIAQRMLPFLELFSNEAPNLDQIQALKNRIKDYQFQLTFNKMLLKKFPSS